MKTAREMCDACIKLGNIPYTAREKPAERNFEIIASSLLPDENVALAFNGILDMKKKGVSKGLFSCAVTEKRILMARKMPFNREEKTLLRSQVNSISYAENRPYTGLGTISIVLISETCDISMDKASAQKVYSALQMA